MGYFWDVFRDAAIAFPDRPFLISQDLSLSYGAAQDAAVRLSDALARSGVPAHCLIGVPAGLGPMETIAILAISRSDCSPVPYLDSVEAEVRRVAELGTAAAVTAQAGELACRRWDSAGEQNDNVSAFAYLLSTSGSTGRPKHVAIGEENIRAYGSYLAASLPVAPADVVAQVYRPHFDAFYNVLLLAISQGAALAVPRPGEALLASDFINRYGVTVWDSVPSIARMAHRAGKLPRDGASSVRLTIFGGEPLRQAELELWRAAAPASTVVNSYGPSEMTIGMCEYRIDAGETPLVRDGYVSLGRPAGQTEIRLRAQDDDGYLDAAGTPCFVDDDDQPVVGVPDAAAWFPTGDAVTLEDGQLFYRGRINRRTFKVLGQRFDPIEVEAVLERDDRVSAAFVHVVDDRVIALLEGGDEPQVRPDRAAGIDYQGLRPHARPSTVRWLDRFPLLPSGKADLRALMSLAEQLGRKRG